MSAGTHDPTGWTAYLDSLEALVDGLHAALDAAEDADGTDTRSDLWLPTVPEVADPLPAGPPPPGSQERREALLERLLHVTVRLEVRRDDVASRIAALPTRRPRNVERYSGALGRGLDLVG